MYEITVLFSAKKVIRFDLRENESLDQRVEEIEGQLSARDFEGCECALETEKIKEVNNGNS